MRLRPGLGATVALIAAPVASRLALASGDPSLAVLLLTTLQLAAFVFLLLRRGAGPAWLGLLPAIGLWLAARQVPAGFAMLADAVLAHGLIQLGLLGLFAGTLRRGHEPLVTQLARRVHGPLRADVIAFTRGVTWAWCLFFAAELLLSVLLLGLAPARWWWRLVPDLCLPLTGLMFVSEHVLRRRLITGFAHANFTAAIGAFRGRSDLVR